MSSTPRTNGALSDCLEADRAELIKVFRPLIDLCAEMEADEEHWSDYVRALEETLGPEGVARARAQLTESQRKRLGLGS